jgi:predicted  nucleic acid-binding Zn-ribbon protein
MNPRDLPEVVSELIIEMHEVRSELKSLNGRVDRLEQRLESLEHTMEEGFNGLREENRQNTDRLIDAFSRSMAPLIDRVLSHEQRLNNLETPQQ